MIIAIAAVLSLTTSVVLWMLVHGSKQPVDPDWYTKMDDELRDKGYL